MTPLEYQQERGKVPFVETAFTISESAYYAPSARAPEARRITLTSSMAPSCRRPALEPQVSWWLAGTDLELEVRPEGLEEEEADAESGGEETQLLRAHQHQQRARQLVPDLSEVDFQCGSEDLLEYRLPNRPVDCFRSRALFPLSETGLLI